MTCHITMERPRLPLSPAQRAFLALHASPVYRHQWHFCQTQLRAHGDAGSATIWADDLRHLLVLGLMRAGVGCADVVLTLAGARAVEEWEMA